MPIPLQNKDRKRAITVIMSKINGAGPSEEPYSPLSEKGGEIKTDTGTAKKTAAQKLMNSVEHRDIEGLQSALETMISLCMSDDDSGEGGYESDR